MSSRVPGVKSCSPKRCSGMLIGASHPYDSRAHHPFTLTRLKSNLQHHCCCRAVCYLAFSPMFSLLVIMVVVIVSNRTVIFFLYLRNTVFLSNLKKQRLWHRKQVSVGLHKELFSPILVWRRQTDNEVYTLLYRFCFGSEDTENLFLISFFSRFILYLVRTIKISWESNIFKTNKIQVQNIFKRQLRYNY